MKHSLIVIAICFFFICVVEWMNYTLNYDYLHDNIPSCVPEDNMEDMSFA